MVELKNNLNILVIEDNVADFVLIEEYLSDQVEELQLVQAKNFKDAKLLLAENAQEYDIIFLDLSLPDKEGIPLISEIVDCSKGIPIIILTGFTDISFSIKSLALGVSDYLLKDDINASILYKSIIYNIERKKASRKLEESEFRYSNMFNSSPQPMYVHDIETLQFLQVNQAAINNYGYTEEEFMKMTIKDIRPVEDMEKLMKFINDITTDPEKKYAGQFRHQKKSGELMDVEIYSNPLKINDKHYRLIIAIDITEKIRLENNITKAILKAQEDERYEIGGELHDNVCQLLASGLMSMAMLNNSLKMKEVTYLDQAKKYLNLALDEIRNLSHRLAPAFFDKMTLEEAFKILADSFNIGDKYKFSLFFYKSFTQTSINRDLQLNLYRILQEQFSNIVKHSGANYISVDLMVNEKNELIMQTVDDGVGFDSTETISGIGFANMKRRAALFSGTIDVLSSFGKGCTLTLCIPLNKNDAC